MPSLHTGCIPTATYLLPEAPLVPLPLPPTLYIYHMRLLSVHLTQRTRSQILRLSSQLSVLPRIQFPMFFAWLLLSYHSDPNSNTTPSKEHLRPASLNCYPVSPPSLAAFSPCHSPCRQLVVFLAGYYPPE